MQKINLVYKASLVSWIHKKKSSTFLALTLGLTVFLFNFAPKELIAPEDRGAFFVIIKAPQGSGFNFTKSKAEDIEKLAIAARGRKRRAGKPYTKRVLVSGKTHQAMNSGFIIVLLEHWSKRDRHGVNIMRESLIKSSWRFSFSNYAPRN